MQIEIYESTYNRLAALVKGFETPDAVINRLIDAFETDQNKRPELVFNPSNEDDFKRAVLQHNQIKVEMFKSDGTCEQGTWNVRAISETSSLRANIWSGYLRGWKEKGIVRAVFTVVEDSSKPEPHESVKWGEYTISRLESGSIIVECDGNAVPVVKPVLRRVAEALGIDQNNSNGNPMNTRQLGGEIIKALMTKAE
ncbi:hypothetical protein PE051_01645 [Enterobacter asburiae]|uniref:hypothetical protein n=1 Tax=Enterobacter asburiae TaxID=61645 RepID=UPI002FF4F61B|nr:hypothetical protein [Enterobacter asburiae]